MPSKSTDASQILIKKAIEIHESPRQKVPFSGNTIADDFLNNIEEYPHFFVLGCVMDRKIKAEKAWIIPYRVLEIIRGTEFIGGTQFSDFLSMNLENTKSIFSENSLHRMPNVMATCFYKAVQKINSDYNGDVSQIWRKGNPKSAEVIKRFDDFYGVGQKISTMAVNTLVREFKVPLADCRAIDISVDVHIDRVFKRLGFVPSDADANLIIQRAREIYPEYPGIFDSLCWEIGEAWCKPTNPLCNQCFLNKCCEKNYQHQS